MPPPVVPPVAEPAPAEADLDPRALRALSRQERKEAKAALRREQMEARAAARQAKADAKIAAKTGRPVEPTHVLPEEEPDDAVSPVAAAVAAVEATQATAADDEPVDAPASADETDAPAAPSAPTDPRARAAQRVQRRLGKDADKLSAAEARARARDEARRRRAQAKELRSGVVAEEPVVRAPEETPSEDLVAEQTMLDETIVTEPVFEQTVVQPPVIEPQVIEPPVVEPPVVEAPVVEPPVVEAPVVEPPAVERTVVSDPVIVDEIPETPEVPEPVTQPSPPRQAPPVTPTTLPMDAELDSGDGRSPLASIAGVLGLVSLGISVLLAVGALLVAVGVDSGGLYEGLKTIANILVGPLTNAFDFSGSNAERKEHFLAWGAGSIVYLLLSFVGQAVQRANSDDQ